MFDVSAFGAAAFERRRFSVCMWAVVLLVSSGAAARSQDTDAGPSKYVEAKTIALKEAFRTKRDWHVTVYKSENAAGEAGNLPVKICFWFDAAKRDADCTTAGTAEYPNQNLREVAVASLAKSPAPRRGVLVDSFFSAGGSGISREIAISAYDRENDEFSEVATIGISEIGEYKIVDSGPLAGSIITALGVWQRDEGHFGDHRFWVQVYKYGEYYQRYEKFLGYLTDRKYPSEELAVIDKESARLSQIVAKIYGDRGPLREPK